jgi:protocatechuate 3,4-dioxygenase alpha subunit
MSAPETPSQTIGPNFHDGLEWAVSRRAGDLRDGEWLVGGVVLDGNGAGVLDAMLEVWQPPGAFQRVFTDGDGRYAFVVRLDSGEAIAHVTVFARGLLGPLRTRLYAGATAASLGARSELSGVPRERLATLAPLNTDAAKRTLDWSIRLQGDGETVFFDLA